jgi:hypothetical protein
MGGYLDRTASISRMSPRSTFHNAGKKSIENFVRNTLIDPDPSARNRRAQQFVPLAAVYSSMARTGPFEFSLIRDAISSMGGKRTIKASNARKRSGIVSQLSLAAFMIVP